MNFLNYKDYRRYLVLNLIHANGPMSRTKLADITGYRPVAIGDLINELLADHLLVETGSAPQSQGRHRMLLDLHSDYICAIGISISAATIVTDMLTIDGQVLQSIAHPIQASGTLDALVQQMIATIRSMLDAFADRKILGGGICDPGPVPGRWNEAANLFPTLIDFNDWVNRDLKAILQRSFTLPVEVYASGILTAVAAERFGAARGLRDFICLEFCNGIGMSYYVNGSVASGANLMAGQLGDTVVHTNDRICTCGKAGCVEASAAFPAIRASILEALDHGSASTLNSFYDRSRELTVADVRRALDQGDKLCRHYVKEAACLLGQATANAINILNPQCVFFHGYMIDLGDYFIRNLEEATRENTMAVFGHVEIKVLTSKLEEELPLGAAAMIFDAFLMADYFRWINRLNVETPDP